MFHFPVSRTLQVKQTFRLKDSRVENVVLPVKRSKNGGSEADCCNLSQEGEEAVQDGQVTEEEGTQRQHWVEMTAPNFAEYLRNNIK